MKISDDCLCFLRESYRMKLRNERTSEIYLSKLIFGFICDSDISVELRFSLFCYFLEELISYGNER